MTWVYQPLNITTMGEFALEIEKAGGYVVVRTNGYLDDIGGEELKKSCDVLIDDGHSMFVFNLARTPVINSTGLSMLLDLVVRVIDYHDGQVALSGLTKLTRTALQMTGILTLCKAFETEQEARDSFSS